MKKTRIWITLPNDVVEWLDREVVKKRFASYSHAVDYVLSEFIKKQK